MNKIINYLKSISLFIILFLIYLLIISLIYYLEILSYNTVSIINYIIILLLFFILGFKTSSLERSKGYLNGFIISTSICILFSILFNSFFTTTFQIPKCCKLKVARHTSLFLSISPQSVRCKHY